MIDHSLTDTITVRKVSPNLSYYSFKFTVNGHEYHYNTKNVEVVEKYIEEIQASKTLKTKIFMEI